MDSLEAQVAGMICLGLGTLFIGLLPACFSSQTQQWPVLLSSLLCFGGGVLLSTSLIHILPELREITENAELLFCIGFFVLYFIDELVHFCSSNQHHYHHSHGDAEMQTRRHSLTTHQRNCNSYGTVTGENTVLLAKSESNIYGKQPSYNPTVCRAHSFDNIRIQEQPPSQICHVNHTEPCKEPPIGHLGLLLALSIHATLEGLAIGLEDSASKVWLLVGAVASHKLVVGFCLGVELSSGLSSTACKHFIAITVFALGSVLGIGIGMTVTNMSNQYLTTVQPILQGLAGGTLLYVTVCEVLPRERARWHTQRTHRGASLVQFAAVVIGFTATTLITKYLDIGHV